MARQQDADSAIIKGAETINLQEGSSHGVLLLHGFGDTPQTLSLLARRLARNGYGVLAPLLPGHGRSMKAFRNSRSDQWVAASRDALREMRERYSKPLLAVVGFSPFEKEEVDMRRELQEIGIPAFHNFERAARAYRNASMYYRFLASVEDAA